MKLKQSSKLYREVKRFVDTSLNKQELPKLSIEQRLKVYMKHGYGELGDLSAYENQIVNLINEARIEELEDVLHGHVVNEGCEVHLENRIQELRKEIDGNH